MQGFDHYSQQDPAYLEAVETFITHAATLFDRVFERADGPQRLQQYIDGQIAFRLREGMLELHLLMPDVVVPDDPGELT
ncbi:hypothetical protein [Phytoactinopolyspora endophytica]|uniref:hypothetical protein n=1 Tax=Phytoactinopolyspora endophytica TaxID=1642495 RepID=UPI00101B6DF3|nr:hypothetical protein [Phytoactinopolyspora endophytica]